MKKEIGPKKFNELVKLEKTKKLQIGTGDVELLLDKPIILGSGKGKAELYDKAIPSFMKKYGKKWNAKVYDDVIDEIDFNYEAQTQDEIGIPVTIIKLTPEMKKAVQQDGQALFSIFGLGGVGASVVSDSIKNNNISQTTN